MPLTTDQIKTLIDNGASDAEIQAIAQKTAAPSRSWGDVWQDVKHFVTGGLDTNELGSMMEPLAHPQTASDIGSLILAGTDAGAGLGKGIAKGVSGVADAAAAAPGAVKSGVNTLATAVRDDPALAKLAQGRPVAATTSLAGRAAKGIVGKIADLTAETPIPRNPSAIAESAAAAQLPRDASAMAGAPMPSPAGPGILQTARPAPTGTAGAAELGDTARAEVQARYALRRTLGGIISQVSGGDPEMTAHLQNYADGAIKQALDAGAQPDPAAVINAVKGEARGYRGSKPVAEPDYMAQLRASLPQVTHPLDTPVDVPTAIMGTNPSPAGVGHAVQALGNEQVKGTLKKLGEQPLYDAWQVMTGEKK